METSEAARIVIEEKQKQVAAKEQTTSPTPKKKGMIASIFGFNRRKEEVPQVAKPPIQPEQPPIVQSVSEEAA